MCKQEMGNSLVSLMQERTKIEKRRKMVGQSDGVGGNDIPFSVDPCKYGP